MFNDTITIYNKYTGQDGLERWKRTVLSGVYWHTVRGATMRKTGQSSADSTQVIVPFTAKAARKYIPPKAWQALTDKSGFYTIQSGDTIIKGNIPNEVMSSIKELNGYDEITVVISVDIKNTGNNMAHFDIMGK